MAGELQMTGATGLTIKAIIWDESGQRWNGSAFAATSSFSADDWLTDGVVTCTELEDSDDNGLGIYAGDWPAITDSADYIVEFYSTSVAAGNLHSTGTYNPVALSNTVNAQVLDVVATDTLVDGKTIQEALRYIAANAGGKLSGAGTGEETLKGLDGSTDRLKFTVTEDGNRTAVSYDP